MDGKSFFKPEKTKSYAKFYQMGTVLDGPTDFVSGRITKKQRKV